MKICVYAICKNEEAFVERWMDSMQEADLIVVTDTGSTDETVAKLRARGALVYEEQIKPWRFDVARNVSLSHVPQDVDICVCTDLDEVFNIGWRQALEAGWQPNMTQGRYLYNWRVKSDGTPDVQFEYTKIHQRQGFEWVYPIHEIVKQTSGQQKQRFIKNLVLTHYPDDTKSRGSYLPLLEMAVKENPQDDRMTYYLGREYMYKSAHQKCIKTLQHYLNLKTATWAEERCAAMRWIAKSYDKLGETEQAYGWYYQAIAQCPSMREPFVEFAQVAYRHRNWELCYFMALQSLKIHQKSKTYINMGYAWDFTPDDLVAISAYYLGMYDCSYEHAKQALTYEPTNERLLQNIEKIELKVKK